MSSKIDSNITYGWYSQTQHRWRKSHIVQSAFPVYKHFDCFIWKDENGKEVVCTEIGSKDLGAKSSFDDMVCLGKVTKFICKDMREIQIKNY